MMLPVDASHAGRLVKQFECLGYPYPRTVEGFVGLLRAFIAITGTAENAEWLAAQVLMGCSRCPTPLELRKIMSKKAPPADGIHESSIDHSDLMAGTTKKGE